MYNKQNEFNDFINYLETDVYPGKEGAYESKHIFVENNAVFFHATPISKAKIIEQNGFMPIKNGLVFFSKSFISSQEYAKKLHPKEAEIAIFAVDLSYLDDDNPNIYYHIPSRELISKEVISADKIIGLHIM